MSQSDVAACRAALLRACRNMTMHIHHHAPVGPEHEVVDVDDAAACMAEREAKLLTITGVWLRREGLDAVVLVEMGGRWVEVVREHDAGPDSLFSHIVEPAGINRSALAAAQKKP